MQYFFDCIAEYEKTTRNDRVALYRGGVDGRSCVLRSIEFTFGRNTVSIEWQSSIERGCSKRVISVLVKDVGDDVESS